MTANHSLQITHQPKLLEGTIALPTSKSISNRALILKALSKDTLSILNLSDADDTRLMKALLKTQAHELNCQNAGTVLRFLTAYYSLQKGERILTGDERMKERPIGPLVEALNKLGGAIEYLKTKGYPPIKIKGQNLKGGSIKLDATTSSQFVTALLLIAPSLEDGLHLQFTGIPVSRPYFNMTVQMLKYLNVKVRQKSDEIAIIPKKLTPKTINVEADWSSASYWMGLATLFPGSHIHLPGLYKDSWQGDRALTSLMKGLGLAMNFNGKADLDVYSEPLDPSTFEGLMTDHPDLVPTFAVLFTLHQIPFDFQGIGHLRHKESDRLAKLKAELEKLGASIELSDNSIACRSFNKIPDEVISIDTHEDHRMAMSFALAAATHSNIIIQNPNVIQKSYPTFWDVLGNMGFEINWH